MRVRCADASTLRYSDDKILHGKWLLCSLHDHYAVRDRMFIHLRSTLHAAGSVYGSADGAAGAGSPEPLMARIYRLTRCAPWAQIARMPS